MSRSVRRILGAALLAAFVTPVVAQSIEQRDFSAWGMRAQQATPSGALTFGLVVASVIVLYRTLLLLARAKQQKQLAPLAPMIGDISHFIGGIRPLADRQALQLSFQGRDFTSLVTAIKALVNLDLRMRVGIYKSGGRTSPAWIEMPSSMPPYGTEAFRKVIVTLGLRRDFCDEASFESIVCAIAHEMAHIILDATGHPRRRDEKVVDLTAMVCGFSEFYVQGTTRRETRGSHTIVHRFGYLSKEEVEFAAKLMKKMRSDLRTSR